MRLFIDTEFTTLTQPALLSFAAVTDDGRELYVELDLHSGKGRKLEVAASTFVKDIVLPQFRRRANDVTRSNLVGVRIAHWLLHLKAERIKVIYDYSGDLELMETALRNARQLSAVFGLLEPAPVHCLPQRPGAKAAMEASWAESYAREGLERHHALADARALRAGFDAAHGTVGHHLAPMDSASVSSSLNPLG